MPKYTVVCPICGKTRKIKQSHVGILVTCGNKECTHELKFRNFSEKIANTIGEPLESAIQRRYILRRMSYREIATELGINGRTVMRILRRLDIEPRHGSDAVATQWENNDERRIAVGKIFIESGKKRTGPNHPCWRGGHRYDNNDQTWRELAEKIRERDGYRCTRCGRTNDECLAAFSKALSVHHIVPFRLSYNNSPSNLRALCTSCHMIMENEFEWLL